MPRNYTIQDKIDREFAFLVTDKANHDYYNKLLQHERLDIHAQVGVVLPVSYELARIEFDGDDFAIVLLDHSSERIAYYVKARVWEDVVLNACPVTQVLLWRTNDVKHELVTTGLARAIFFQYLLDRYNVVASDCNQTVEGRDFWIRQTGFALLTGLHVYRYHRIECDLVEILDHAVIRDNSCDLWGDDEDYCNVLAIISKDSIAQSVD
ncbi:hypothetical protein D8T58_22280 [Vibrio vulnificus]|nr:hypothetical protein D8T58_22220 [Vibrio vulnificus]RZR40266.1 hypothetical protein D8T58_22280 [Vibrio vulnificus]